MTSASLPESDATLFRARVVCLSADDVFEDGGIVVERGHVARVLRSSGEVQRASSSWRTVELEDALLIPGLVNAHAHLELSALAGRIAPGESFPDWIRGLLVARGGVERDELRSGLASGAARLARSGCTSVGDIDSLGLTVDRLPLRRCAYRELLDVGDAQRTEEAISSLGDGARYVSPHAPYTVSRKLAAAIGRYAREHGSRVAIHWAETREEVEWLSRGVGPFSALLPEASDARRGSGLDRIEEAGLLGPRTALVHANHPDEGDRERVAASGATIVHCPGTHRFFEREPFDLLAWAEAGVPIAIGTDSLASNDSLDLVRELALLREAHPALAPSDVVRCATEGGARVIGSGSGTLAAGERADFAVFELAGAGERDALDALTSAELSCRATWLAGVPVPNDLWGADPERG